MVRINPSFLHCSALAKHITLAFLANANWFLDTLCAVYFLNLKVSSLWKIRSAVSEIAIGLYLPSDFGINIALNLYSVGIYEMQSGLFKSLLNIFTKYEINTNWCFAMYLRCAGPIPDGPQLLCLTNYLIAFSISSCVMSSNCSLFD